MLLHGSTLERERSGGGRKRTPLPPWAWAALGQENELGTHCFLREGDGERDVLGKSPGGQ